MAEKLKLKAIYEWIQEKFQSLIDPENGLKALLTRVFNSAKKALVFLGLLTVIIVAGLAVAVGLMTRPVYQNIVQVSTNIPIAQSLDSSVNVVSSILTCIVSVVALYSGYSSRNVRDALSGFITVLNASRSIGKFIMNLLTFFPSKFVTGLRVLCGEIDQGAVQDRIIEAMTEWQALESLSWVGSVTSSDKLS